MLEGGKIIEEGTHDQLMQANGPYANMYAVQSSYYKNTDSSNNANMTEVSYLHLYHIDKRFFKRLIEMRAKARREV